MAIDDTTAACLRDYQEQLIKLDLDDIRVPNQSLILDYFCTDSELTEFLRNEVFLESAKRHNVWKKLNQRSTPYIKLEIDDEVSHLLGSGNSHASRVWADIVRLTACQQAHQELAQYINERANNKQLSSADAEEVSLCQAIQSGTESITVNTSKQSLDNSSYHIQQQNRGSESARSAKDRLPFLVASFALLGLLGIAVSTANYETTNTSQNGTTLDKTASDSSQAVVSLNNLEAEQKGAVLICEHKPIIEKAKSLDLVEGENIARRDALIASSNKQIAFLDQKSAQGFKYWEDSSCTWGEQWFDKQSDNQFRLFLAVSRKCPNPTVNYKYTKDEEGKALLSRGKYNAYGHSKGEVRIPYPPQFAYIFVESITCS